MPVQYPAGLPGPSAYPFVPRERRATPGIAGFQQLRSRARDAIVDAPGVRWRYTPAEFATWLIWYEEELLIGQKWFAMTLPGRGGPLSRVARYVSAVQRNHLANGNFELTADLELRGIAQPPEDRLGPAFAIGWADPYNDVDGSIAHANTDTYSYFSGFLDFEPLIAGVVGYTSGAVIWGSTWAPTDGGSAPVLSAVVGRPELVRVTWPEIPASLRGYSEGMLTLTAALDGTPVPAGQDLVATASGSSYSSIAWGPEP